MKILIYITITLLLVFSTAASRAEDPAVLTEDAIRALYKEMTEIHRLDYDKCAAALENMLHDKFEGSFTTTVIAPWKNPPSKTESSPGKKDFIKQLLSEFETLKKLTITGEVTGIQISQDGGEAFVKNESSTRDLLLQRRDGGEIGLESSKTCDDVVVMGKNNAPQILKSTCEVTVKFQNRP